MIQTNKNNHKSSASQLINFMPGSYLDRTSRPIYALAYLLGFIIFYEIGTIFINPETIYEVFNQRQVRVVSFVWLQNLLTYIGFSARMTWLATPLVVIIILLALQITSRTPWDVCLKDFLPMSIESILLAVPLIVLSLALNRSLTPQAAVEQIAAPSLMTSLVTAVGAGIYEELIFRLILICLLMMIFQDLLGVSRSTSIILSVVISAGLFSLHHHVYFANGKFGFGEIFVLQTFLFRTVAGVYFAILFAVRGFGITVGTHIFYDIIAALLNAALFSG